MNKRIFIIAIIGMLFIGDVYFGLKSIMLGKELARVKKETVTFNRNGKIINFSKLFIDEVLKAGKEVDFDTRLKLENAVREIKDEAILAQWDKFVKSKTEEGAQEEVKNLLSLLIKKI